MNCKVHFWVKVSKTATRIKYRCPTCGERKSRKRPG